MDLSQISTIIWDVDGTLYLRNKALNHDVREAELIVLQNHTNWDRKQVEEEFYAVYPKKSSSATKAVALLTNISTEQAAKEMEEHFSRDKYLTYDQKLVDLFSALSTFDHYILTNGVEEVVYSTLAALGLQHSQFVEIVTSEKVGDNKPTTLGYEYILKQTGKPPNTHLMVGDRDSVDLQPAKKVGMQTCLVFADEKTDNADVVCTSVYDVADLFTE